MLDKILAWAAIAASLMMLMGLGILFLYVAPYVLVGLLFSVLGSFVLGLAIFGFLWGLYGLGVL
jgi:hypothetical protein